MEIWREIENYPNYNISNFGNVKNIRTNKILKNNVSTTGYHYVIFYNNSKQKHMLNHRMVAKAFIDNPLNKPNIDHKNNNPLDNRIENLRWCTQQENMRNASVQCNNTSEHKGVVFDKSRNKWQARIQVNGKNILIGRYDDKNDAIQARKEKSNEIFGEFTHSSEKI